MGGSPASATRVGLDNDWGSKDKGRRSRPRKKGKSSADSSSNFKVERRKERQPKLEKT